MAAIRELEKCILNADFWSGFKQRESNRQQGIGTEARYRRNMEIIAFVQEKITAGHSKDRAEVLAARHFGISKGRVHQVVAPIKNPKKNVS
jgi:hypothetical protein